MAESRFCKAVILFAAAGIGGQVYAQTFAMTYADATAGTEAAAVRQTSTGEYIVAGTRYYSNGTQAAWAAEVNSSGNLVWQKQYQQGYLLGVNALGITSDGGFVVAGFSAATNASFAVVWVAKMDSGGNIVWQTTYGGNDGDTATSVQQTTDGGYAIAGVTNSFPDGVVQAWFLKLDANGDAVFQNTYNNSVADVTSAFASQQTSDGGYVVAGVLAYRMWVAKLDASGNLTWNMGYNNDINGETEGYSSILSIQQTTDGGYIAAGWSQSSGTTYVSLLKLDQSGNITWQNYYTQGSSKMDDGSVRQTSDGGYIVMGAINRDARNFSTPLGILLLKLESSGDLQWQWRYNDPGLKAISGASIQTTSDGGFVIAGTATSAALLKLDSSGTIASCGKVQNQSRSTGSASTQTAWNPSTVQPAETNATVSSPKTTTLTTFLS